MTVSPIESLPQDVLERTGSFLDDRCLGMFSACSKFFRRKFPITRLERPTSIENLQLTGAYGNGDDFFETLTIPMAFPCRTTRTVRFSCVWRDQGWGNRKGRVAIIASRTDDTMPGRIPESDLNVHGQLVSYTSEVAGHHAENLVLTFCPKPNEKYTLYMKAGGGGGHQLHLEQVLVHRVIFDKLDWSISRNFRILSDLRVIGPVNNSPFLFELLQSTVTSMLHGSQEARSGDLSNFLQSHGLLVEDTSSLESIQELLTCHDNNRLGSIHQQLLTR